MAFDPMTVPKFAFRAGTRAVDVALGLAGHLRDRFGGDGDERPRDHAEPPAPPTASAASRAAAPTRDADSPTAVPVQRAERDLPASARPAPAPAAVPAIEPDELVAESADPGAEDGAGAQVRIDEPWPGYDRMTAADITDRLVAADAATIATVQLYEGANRGRRSVLTAAEARLARS